MSNVDECDCMFHLTPIELSHLYITRLLVRPSGLIEVEIKYRALNGVYKCTLKLMPGGQTSADVWAIKDHN